MSGTQGIFESDVRLWTARSFGLIFAAELVPWSFVVPLQEWVTEVEALVVIGLYVVYCVWAALVVGKMIRFRGLSRRFTASMIVVMAGCVVVVGLACPVRSVVSWHNWTPAPATGVAAAVWVFSRRRDGVAAVVILGGAYVVTAWRDLQSDAGAIASLLGDLAQLVAFTVVIGLIWEKLAGMSRTADRTAREASAAREGAARLAERVRTYEVLHTNVLTLLTVVARGTGDPGDAVRARCAREVVYLRARVHEIVGTAGAGDSPTLNVALADVVSAQSALGIEVHYHPGDLPSDVPEPAVEALAEAVAEALNDTVKHAGVDEAWVVAAAAGERVRVTVTDRGQGFDTRVRRTGGVGIDHCVRDRIAAIGGRAEVKSYPGEGTCVEIIWPA